ncbi:hypothetical protein ACFVVA_16855 [Kitasatospora sp. NPDC058048]|uniref:hypothetical protein n=1 Tax=Kitasatospora sp. NPDC058048 TaxID=3346313 RepID=UPI0036DC9465
MTVESHKDCGPVYTLSPDEPVFVSKRVRRGQPVMSVHLDEDGDWQAFSGTEPRWWKGGPRLVHAAHLLESDPSMAALPALPLNHWATREDASSTAWQVFRG